MYIKCRSPSYLPSHFFSLVLFSLQLSPFGGFRFLRTVFFFFFFVAVIRIVPSSALTLRHEQLQCVRENHLLRGHEV